MQFSTGGVAAGTAASTADQPRVYYRHPINSLIYVTLDEGNGGIIRNLSQGGAAIQAVAPLHLNQNVRLRFDLLNPRARLDVRAEVAWANPGGQAGVRFVDLTPHSKSLLNDWIFATLLRGIEQASPVLTTPEDGEDLILSPGTRPAIRLPHADVQGPLPNEPSNEEPKVSLAWWPRPIPARALAGIMDGLVLFSAVLIFFCTFLSIVQAMPPWPVALGLLFGVGGFFTALYWYLFGVMGRGTAGVFIAKLATRDMDSALQAELREKEARFR
jgi:Tfp pilus assembly protein PilZ